MQKIKCVEREGYVTYYDSDRLVLVPDHVDKKEMRGVWFSTVNNIDFQPQDSVLKYQEMIDKVIDKCLEYNLNAIIFQVRPNCDALYESNINPWSNFLSVNHIEGENPGFDIFQYLIEKAKQHNIEVHAWINPYRVRSQKLNGLTKEQFIQKNLHPSNFAYQHPEEVIETVEDKLILDPASAVVQEYLANTVYEIASKYDIKAVHIDDYFYPYEEIRDPLEEQKRNKIAPNMSIADFRRNNVDKMIEKIHLMLKKLDKHVEFGISPFAVYRTNSKHFTSQNRQGGWEKGSNNHCSCLEGYESLYADVYYWMQKGWIDYVVPQVYFSFDSYKVTDKGEGIEIIKYADMVDWWAQVSKETNIKCYIGQAIYRYSDNGNWSNPEELINQLKYNSLHKNIQGSVMFTYHNFIDNAPKSLITARQLLKEVWKNEN